MSKTEHMSKTELSPLAVRSTPAFDLDAWETALFAAAMTGQDQRPRCTLPVLREAGAHRLAPRLAAWHIGRAPGGVFPIERAARQLTDATRSCCTGAKIVRILEQRYDYQPDDDLLELLDDFTLELFHAYDRMIAAWVTRHGIKPTRRYGEEVRVRTNNSHWQRIEVTGEIVGIDLKHARYALFIPELGHVRDGPGVNARPVPFDDVLEIAYGLAAE
jgi:hypothetical protein